MPLYACLIPLAIASNLGSGGLAVSALTETRADQSLAFIDVDVLPMDTDRVLSNQTVLVRAGQITWIGPAAEADTPEDALEIPGNGRFLAPGLIDMHVHVMSADELPLYVINGVTTVRNMWGNPDHLRWRAEIESGDRIGPNMLTCGAILDGFPAQLPGSAELASIDDAFLAIEEQAEAGYDFIKVYNRLTPEIYEAVVAIATEFELEVVGHVPRAVGLDQVLAAGQHSIEHLWGYPAAMHAPSSTAFPSWAFDLDARLLSDLCTRTASAHVWNTPTLVMWEGQELSAAETRAFLERDEISLVPSTLRRMAFGQPYEEANDLPADERACRRENRLAVVRALHQSGAGLLLGTDTGNPFVLPGFAVHDELALLIEAGLSHHAAIASGTTNVGRFLGLNIGTLEVGARADLVLVEKNPLKDPATLRRPSGVAINGRWLDAAKLAALRTEIEER
ncbi:MAG: imidazolonepropionase-like amidohydrolase [Chlamydiales bacterium]|jgi:imidazolonepropionase-like amidohydrolase